MVCGETSAGWYRAYRAEQKELPPSEWSDGNGPRQDDSVQLYDLLGSKEYRKELDKQFKTTNQFRRHRGGHVADRFDVPELDTIYIDKPLQKHNLIRPSPALTASWKAKVKGWSSTISALSAR